MPLNYRALTYCLLAVLMARSPALAVASPIEPRSQAVGVSDAEQDSRDLRLLEAARLGQAGVVTILLKAGAQVDQSDMNGLTPLHMAARCEHAEVVKILLEAGADPRATNTDGKTPHAIARGEACRDLLWNAMMEKPLK